MDFKKGIFMICYPASSSILSADEIEYISGGSSGTGAVFSLVGAVFSVINAINVVNIKQIGRAHV